MELTVNTVKEALAKVTNDVYGWAYTHALQTGKGDFEVWEDLVKLVSGHLGVEARFSWDVSDSLADVVDDEQFTSRALDGEIDGRAPEVEERDTGIVEWERIASENIRALNERSRRW